MTDQIIINVIHGASITILIFGIIISIYNKTSLRKNNGNNIFSGIGITHIERMIVWIGYMEMKRMEGYLFPAKPLINRYETYRII